LPFIRLFAMHGVTIKILNFEYFPKIDKYFYKI